MLLSKRWQKGAKDEGRSEMLMRIRAEAQHTQKKSVVQLLLTDICLTNSGTCIHLQHG
jgi:hypothetical protein